MVDSCKEEKNILNADGIGLFWIRPRDLLVAVAYSPFGPIILINLQMVYVFI
jgi:hypothetical protein